MAKVPIPLEGAGGSEPEVFRIRPTSASHKESQVGELFESDDERLWVLSQLRLLRWWPLDRLKQEELAIDLDFSTVHSDGQTFYELRLHDGRLSHNGNLRVFFWVHDPSRTIWIVHGYWKKSQRLDEPVKKRVARRIRNLRGEIQDGSIS
jgi:phage-related protein